MRSATLSGFHAQMKHSEDPSQHEGANVPDVTLLGEWRGAAPVPEPACQAGLTSTENSLLEVLEQKLSL